MEATSTGIDDVVACMRARACSVTGCESFAEVAAVALARQLLRKGRRLDARKLLSEYLQRHPSTPRIAAAWSAAA